MSEHAYVCHGDCETKPCHNERPNLDASLSSTRNPLIQLQSPVIYGPCGPGDGWP